MHVVCIRMLLSASICLSTLQKHEGGFVLILKSAWGVLSMLYFWAWGVLSAFKKTWWFSSTYNKMDVGCFVRGVFCPTLNVAVFDETIEEGRLFTKGIVLGKKEFFRASLYAIYLAYCES